MCHFIGHEANLSNALPSVDAFHPSYEVIRGDRQRLKSNFLWVFYVYPYLLNFVLKLYIYIYFFFFEAVISKSRSCLHNLNQILYFDFFFTFSYSLLIILNRSGLFNLIPSHDDENSAMFFNRACCFRYLNKINPSFAMF